ncbi:hypothetical protein TNCV_125771, partial [Trichonephila clavipes]
VSKSNRNIIRSLDSTRRFVQRPRHRLIAVASLGRLPRNRSIQSGLLVILEPPCQIGGALLALRH